MELGASRMTALRDPSEYQETSDTGTRGPTEAQIKAAEKAAAAKKAAELQEEEERKEQGFIAAHRAEQAAREGRIGGPTNAEKKKAAADAESRRQFLEHLQKRGEIGAVAEEDLPPPPPLDPEPLEDQPPPPPEEPERLAELPDSRAFGDQPGNAPDVPEGNAPDVPEANAPDVPEVGVPQEDAQDADEERLSMLAETGAPVTNTDWLAALERNSRQTADTVDRLNAQVSNLESRLNIVEPQVGPGEDFTVGYFSSPEDTEEEVSEGYKGPFYISVEGEGATVKVNPGYVFAGADAGYVWPGKVLTGYLSAADTDSYDVSGLSDGEYIIRMKIQVHPDTGYFTDKYHPELFPTPLTWSSSLSIINIQSAEYAECVIGLIEVKSGVVTKIIQGQYGHIYCPVFWERDESSDAYFVCSWKSRALVSAAAINHSYTTGCGESCSTATVWLWKVEDVASAVDSDDVDGTQRVWGG
jgi:hypothetical protein